MTTITHGSFVFGENINSTRSGSFRRNETVEVCDDPYKRDLLVIIGLIKKPTAAAVTTFAPRSPEASVDALMAFGKELGLSEEMGAARRDLGALLRENGHQEGLRDLRLRAGLSQSDLAKAVGTSQPRIAALEAGKSGMGLGVGRKIAAALGVSLDQLAAAVEGHSP